MKCIKTSSPKSLTHIEGASRLSSFSFYLPLSLSHSPWLISSQHYPHNKQQTITEGWGGGGAIASGSSGVMTTVSTIKRSFSNIGFHSSFFPYSQGHTGVTNYNTKEGLQWKEGGSATGGKYTRTVRMRSLYQWWRPLDKVQILEFFPSAWLFPILIHRNGLGWMTTRVRLSAITAGSLDVNSIQWKGRLWK